MEYIPTRNFGLFFGKIPHNKAYSAVLPNIVHAIYIACK